MNSNDFDVESFLRSIRSRKPPWECPKCHKMYKSYSGMEYHLVKFDHSSSNTPVSRLPPVRKSKLKFSKKKNNKRLYRRSPSPIELFSPPRDTLTWAEAQQMVELESDGRVYRLNISDKLDILSDSDEENNHNSLSKNSHSTVKNDQTCLNTGSPKSPHKKSSFSNHTESKKLARSLLPMPLHKNSSKYENSSSSLPKPSFRILSSYDAETTDAPPRPTAYYRYIEKLADELEDKVEYDMDEEDAVWLELMNKHREKDGLGPVTDSQLELLMDRFEKESYFEQAKKGHNSQSNQSLIDEDAVCCVCNDGECQNSNVILFCDMCNLAIHQECYGVPYIPEGQWLCRRCLQSPSSPVDCCLCPNKSGAFKQTDDGRWSHVVCALWVPEVGFGNTVFLEPIDGLKNVPSARWKLTCYVCKQRNAGACIQCHRTNCYTAFHVTCAQQAGLYMKMEPVKKSGENGVTITVKKEAYCDVHTPANASPRHNKFNGQALPITEKSSNEKMKKARKLLAEKRLEIPQISIPYIPRSRMSSISKLVSLQKKNSFMQRLLSYWTLKRQSRNGVPLLRRLQSHVHPQRPLDPRTKSEEKHVMEQVKMWQRLRHDLEHARLLVELIRKREKLKRELVKISEVITKYRLWPLNLVLQATLAKLSSEETLNKVFSEPVKTSDAPDYYNIIQSPMDLSTMKSKIENFDYLSLSEFEDDLNLIVNNCILYNGRVSAFYRYATKLRDHSGAAIRATKREIARIGLDAETGILLSHTPEKKAERVINDKERLKLPLKQQLDIMLTRLDHAMLHGRKTKKIRLEVSMLKRRIARGQSNTSSSVIEADQSNPSNSSRADDDSLNENNLSNDMSVTPTHRKRLWSDRRSPSPTSPTAKKKKLLEKAESYPLSSQENIQVLKENETPHFPGITSKTPPPSNSVRQIKDNTSRSVSLPPSPSRESVNRRSAVLFNKKPRGFPSIKTSPDLLSLKNGIEQADVKHLTSDLEKQSNGNRSSDESKKQPTSSSVLVNGISSHTNGEIDPDEADKSEMSFQNYREEFHSSSSGSSDSDDRSSTFSGVDSLWDRKKKLVKKRRRHSSDASSSYNESLDGEDDDRPDSECHSFVSKDNDHKHDSDCPSDDDIDLPHIAPLDLVWAKCWGYPPYPALLIDPKMPRVGFCHNGVPIPIPPLDVLQAGRDKRNEGGTPKNYLVLFFDTKRTWQWLSRSKLELLGIDYKADQAKLNERRRPAVRKNVEAAYQRALLHRSKVTGVIPDSDDELTNHQSPPLDTNPE